MMSEIRDLITERIKLLKKRAEESTKNLQWSMGTFLSASRPQEQSTSDLESRPAHETSAQQEAQKGNDNVAASSSSNFDADDPSDFNAGMNSSQINSHLVLSSCRTLSQLGGFEKSSLMTKIWSLYHLNINQTANFLQTQRKTRRISRAG